MLPSQAQPPSRTALVIVPAGLNYFYELHGRRLAEALQALGLGVEVRTLSTSLEGPFDWCVLTNITEILISHAHAGAVEVSHEITPAQERAALDAIRRLHKSSASLACCS